MSDHEVVVIGGGFAGLSAAVRLAAAGARVAVVEARPRLGGRATAFTDPATGDLVDNGQHLLLGCYHETFAFLRAIGAEANVRLQPNLEVPFIDRAGVRTVLACPTLPSPLHLLAGLVEWDALGFADRVAALRMVRPLQLARRHVRRGDRIAASPGETVENWLIRNGQTPRIREMLWEPLALAALNQPASEAAAPVFARVLALMFGPDPRDAAIALPVRPLHLMYAEPAREFIEQKGGRVMTGKIAKLIVDDHAAERVVAGDEEFRASSFISAVPWFALDDLVPGSPPELAGLLDAARRMRSSPIVTVNLWFDRPFLGAAFVGLPGRHFQWVFDKREAFGDQASHLSLVSSGASAIAGMSNDEVTALALGEITTAIPAARTATLARASVVRERRSTFSLAPDQPARPGTRTAIRNLFLAGDWIDTGLPGTIESAVASGHLAATAILADS
jgi:squalene-associated FAD-dependent desaturase